MLDRIRPPVDPEDRSMPVAIGVLLADDGSAGPSRTLERSSNSLIDSHARRSFGIPAARAARRPRTLDSDPSIDPADLPSKTRLAVVDRDDRLSIVPTVGRSWRSPDSPNPTGASIDRKNLTVVPSS